MTENNQEMQNFDAYYVQHVKPLEDSFEQKWIKAIEIKNKCKGTAIIVFVIVAVIVAAAAMMKLLPENMQLRDAAYAVLAMCVPLAFWVYHPITQYKQNIKQDIFPKIFGFFGNIDYSFKVPVNLKELKKKSGIIPQYHSNNLEDYVAGDLDGVELKMFQADLKRQESSGSGKNKTHRTITVFKGVIISLSMNKNFSGKTVVKKDAGKIGNFFKGSDLSGLQRVTLESSEFEKDFEVYSSDQVEARYLLTPTFMERLLQLSSLYSTNKSSGMMSNMNLQINDISIGKNSNSSAVQCSFYDDQVLITIPSQKDFFEVASVDQPVNFKNDANIIIEEIQQIKKIVEVLKLNQRTGI